MRAEARSISATATATVGLAASARWSASESVSLTAVATGATASAAGAGASAARVRGAVARAAASDSAAGPTGETLMRPSYQIPLGDHGLYREDPRPRRGLDSQRENRATVSAAGRGARRRGDH